MQFLPENCLNSCQIFGRFGSFKTEAEPICSFLHTPTTWMLFVGVPLLFGLALDLATLSLH